MHYRYLKIYCHLILFFLFVNFGIAQKNTVDLEDKKVLIVYGGWQGHEPKIFAEKIAKWLLEQKAEVKLFEGTAIYANPKVMKDLDLIIQHITMDEITLQESEGLVKTIAGGAGLAGCHGGLGDSFRENTEYQYMVGGQFVKHPGGQVSYTVQIDAKKDPITKGINDFSLYSEQYYMHVDPALDVLASTKFSGVHDSWINGAIVPVVWKKSFDKGRVFYISIGHSKDNFEIPEVWTLITRGISWAAQKE